MQVIRSSDSNFEKKRTDSFELSLKRHRRFKVKPV